MKSTQHSVAHFFFRVHMDVCLCVSFSLSSTLVAVGPLYPAYLYVHPAHSMSILLFTFCVRRNLI